MDRKLTTSRQQRTPSYHLPSIQMTALSLLLVCFVFYAATTSAGAAEPVSLSLLSPQNALLSLLVQSGAPTITLTALPASSDSVWDSSLQPDKAAGYFMAPSEAIPVDILCTPSTVPGGNNVSSTVTVNQTGSYVQVGCDHPSLLTSPSGSWPYNVNFPLGGPTSQNITITSGAVSSNTTVKIYACQAGLDINNPANWQSVSTITVTP